MMIFNHCCDLEPNVIPQEENDMLLEYFKPETKIENEDDLTNVLSQANDDADFHPHSCHTFGKIGIDSDSEEDDGKIQPKVQDVEPLINYIHEEP